MHQFDNKKEKRKAPINGIN